MGKTVKNHQKNSSTQSFHTEQVEHNDYNIPNSSKNISDYSPSQSSPTVKHILISKRLKDFTNKKKFKPAPISTKSRSHETVCLKVGTF